MFAARRCFGLLCLAIAASATAPASFAQKRYDPGASDAEIKIGNIVPYSGALSAYGTIGRSAGAYFAKVNAEGGVNGRKIVFVSVDDAYNPAKSVEQARKLVEQDEVFAIVYSLGTAQNAAIQKYMNAKKVPQLFVGSGAARWGNVKEFPWTLGWLPTYESEARTYAQHVLQTRPAAKIAILMQNDDFGREYLDGLMHGLGDKAKAMVVARQTYEPTDPTVESQIIAMKASGADTLMLLATPKYVAMALKKAGEISWQPQRYVASVSNSVGAVLKVAGLDASKGVISATYLRDPTDPATQATPPYKDYADFMRRYYPSGDVTDSLNLIGYSVAQTLVQTLRQAGDNLTRENLMKQAMSLDLTLPMLYPGIRVESSATDAYPIEAMQLIQFNGTLYEPIGQMFGR